MYCSMMGVAPRPETSTTTSSPSTNGRSGRTMSTISSAISSALLSGSTRTPGSPWWPMPTSIVPGSIEKLGLPLAGIVQGPRPMPTLRVLSTAFWAQAMTSSSEPPMAAFAPPHFHIMISPATPRRLSRSVGGALGTSSLATTRPTAMPSFSTARLAILTFMLSPA